MSRQTETENLFFADYRFQPLLQLPNECQINVVLIYDQFIQVDVGHLRGHGVKAVPYQRILQEFQKQFAVRTDRLDCGFIHKASLFFFERTNYVVGRLPFLGEVA